MSLASILLIIFALTALFCVGLVVLARNLTRFVRISFTCSILSLVIWYVCLYVSNINFPHTLFFNQIVYVGPILAIVSFGLFLSAAFGLGEHKIAALNKWSVAIAVPTVLIAGTRFNIQAVKPRYDHGHITGFSVVLGPLGSLVTISLLVLVLMLIRHSYVIYKGVDQKNRRPLLLTLAALAFTLLVSSATNVVAPSLRHGSSAANAISNLSTLLFIGTMTYCVLRYSFLNIRFFVVRGVGYLFTLMLITVFYLVPSIWLVSHIVKVSITAPELLLLVGLSLILTFVYRYLRHLFDRLTHQLFFRNFYESQDILDRLGELLVRTLDVEQMQSGSKKILLEAIRTRALDYWFDTNTEPKVLQSFKRLFTYETDTNVVVLDEGHAEQAVTQQLYERDIAVVVRLRTTRGDLGYMTLGFKDSGQAYTTQDKRLLGTAADEIAISMQNALHFEEIQNFNKTLQEKVNVAVGRLQQTNKKLQALDATKDEFISMASHQLRTPLTSVKGYLSMVLEGDAGKLNAQQKQLLTQSFISAQRMVYLISDLLNLSRLSTGKFVIEPTPTDLNEVVQGEIDQLRETAKSRDIALSFDAPASLPKLMLDETKIHQVVMNFIDNAIYYTPAGGDITVALTETPSAVEYTVKDNGIGVPRAEQRHLFTKFYRAGNARKARPDGTGLGLFMAKKVIAAQGGSIIFESTEGKGSTFGFRFSKAKHLAPEPLVTMRI